MENLSPLEKSIIRNLIYYHIFKHPLTLEELVNFSNDVTANISNISVCLDNLIRTKLIFNSGKHFSISDDESNFKKRKTGGEKADSLMNKAMRNGNFIAKFPYVRAVFLSGSISKGYMGENADIDYFVVTKPNRLWVARSMLMLYKKLFLFNSHRFFCINYFISSDYLEVEEKIFLRPRK